MAEWKNYITPRGYKRLLDEQQQIWSVIRPKVVDEVAYAASLGDRSENAEYIYGKKKLRKLDSRLRWIRKRIEAAEVIDPAIDRADKVFFGATVTLLYQNDTERRFSLVGEDEIELQKSRISWRSPIGRAVMGKREGDEVRIRRPEGMAEVEILEVEYLSQKDDDTEVAIFRDISLGGK
jgi:transcription elongation factor GreB